jgi:hypothetical protein
MDTRIKGGIGKFPILLSSFVFSYWCISVIVAGNTACGKSTLVADLLSDLPNNFDADIGEVVVCTNKRVADEAMLKRIRLTLPADVRLQIESGFPAEALEQGKLFSSNKKRILFCDDMFDDLHRNHRELLEDLATTMCHHLNIILIITTQSLQATPSQRKTLLTLLRNASVIVCFADYRAMGIIQTLARQFFTGNHKKLIEPFTTVLSSTHKHDFVVIDFGQSYENCVRSGGLCSRDAYIMD